MNSQLERIIDAVLSITECSRGSPEFYSRVSTLLKIYVIEFQLDIFKQEEEIQTIEAQFNLYNNRYASELLWDECLLIISQQEELRILFPLTISIIVYDLTDLVEPYRNLDDPQYLKSQFLLSFEIERNAIHRLKEPFKSLIMFKLDKENSIIENSEIISGYAKVSILAFDNSKPSIITETLPSASKLSPALCATDGLQLWSHRTLGRAFATPITSTYFPGSLPSFTNSVEFIDLALAARGGFMIGKNKDVAANDWLLRYTPLSHFLSGLWTAFRDYGCLVKSVAMNSRKNSSLASQVISDAIIPKNANDQYAGLVLGLGIQGLLHNIPSMFTISLISCKQRATEVCAFVALSLSLIGTGCEVWAHQLDPRGQVSNDCTKKSFSSPALALSDSANDDYKTSCPLNSSMDTLYIDFLNFSDQSSPKVADGSDYNGENFDKCHTYPDGSQPNDRDLIKYVLPFSRNHQSVADILYAPRDMRQKGMSLLRVLKLNMAGYACGLEQGKLAITEHTRAVSPLAIGILCAGTSDPTLTAMFLRQIKQTTDFSDTTMGKLYMMHCGIGIGLINIQRCINCTLRPQYKLITSLMEHLAYEAAYSHARATSSLMAIAIVSGGLNSFADIQDGDLNKFKQIRQVSDELSNLLSWIQLEISARMPIFSFIDSLIARLIVGRSIDLKFVCESIIDGTLDDEKQLEHCADLAIWSLALGLDSITGGIKSPELTLLMSQFEEIEFNMISLVKETIPLDFSSRKRRLELSLCHDLFILGVSLCITFEGFLYKSNGNKLPETESCEIFRLHLMKLLSKYFKDPLDYHFGRSYILSICTALLACKIKISKISFSDRNLLRALLVASILPPPPVTPPTEDIVSVVRHTLYLVLGRIIMCNGGNVEGLKFTELYKFDETVYGRVIESSDFEDLVDLMNLLTRS